ncbi:hypothetical protein [Planctobacterium marinum]|nr:hypothetical protein [Planctobacterium marinum]MCC2606298.1 hypothetical protein [Planctobacterium marinum]
MKRNNVTQRRNINCATRRKQLLKKLQRKVNMRRQDFQSQLEMQELATAG